MLAVWPYRGYIGTREAVLRVRSHISPGPYRSFRELSLAGSVDPDIWCPPTFVGNSGIECSNGYRGFALLVFVPSSRHTPPSGLAFGESDAGLRRNFSADFWREHILDRSLSRVTVTERSAACRLANPICRNNNSGP